MDFFSDLLRLKRAGKLPAFSCAHKGGLMYFHLAPLLEIWLKDFYDRTNEPILLKTEGVREYLRSQPGFLTLNVNKKIRGKVFRCVVFVRSKAPAGLLELLDGKCMDNRGSKAAKRRI